MAANEPGQPDVKSAINGETSRYTRNFTTPTSALAIGTNFNGDFECLSGCKVPAERARSVRGNDCMAKRERQHVGAVATPIRNQRDSLSPSDCRQHCWVWQICMRDDDLVITGVSDGGNPIVNGTV